MARVMIEVASGAHRFGVVAVRAESIRRAVSLTEGRYPHAEVRVRFPIDPESFFVEDPTARAGLIEPERPERTAA